MKVDQKLGMSIAMATIMFVAGCCCCRAPEPPGNGVQIQVNVSSLSDAEIEELKSKLADIAGNDANVTAVFNGEAMWNYTTDLEPQAFADKIDFATVKSVNDRVITLDLATPSGDDSTADGTDGTTDAATDGAADGTTDGTTDAAADGTSDDGATADSEPATDAGADGT